MASIQVFECKKCMINLDARVKRWALDAGLWTLDAGLWTLDAALWTLNAGLWTLNARLWTLKILNLKLSKGLETMDLYQQLHS